MSAARMKHFGWGREGEGLSAEEEAFVMTRAEARFGAKLQASASAPTLDEIKLDAPRIAAPASLSFCTSDHYDRTAHTFGKSYPDLARGLARDYANAPDVVAYPRNESEVAAVLDWGGRRGCDRHTLRRRIERVRRCRAAAQESQRCCDDQPARDGQREGGRQDVARRADQGLYLWPRARSAAQAAWANAPPFPAELRVFDARRLDRDARGGGHATTHRGYGDEFHAELARSYMAMDFSASGRVTGTNTLLITAYLSVLRDSSHSRARSSTIPLSAGAWADAGPLVADDLGCRRGRRVVPGRRFRFLGRDRDRGAALERDPRPCVELATLLTPRPAP